MKKINYDLQIKADELDIINEQMDALRKICDKLEEEKKQSVFREESLRMRIESLANSGNS